MKVYDLVMSRTEVKPISLEVKDLQEGENLSDGNITHTPPEGGSPVTIDYSVDGNFLNMAFGPFAVVGYHYVMVQAIGDGSVPSMPEVLYVIRVK